MRRAFILKGSCTVGGGGCYPVRKWGENLQRLMTVIKKIYLQGVFWGRRLPLERSEESKQALVIILIKSNILLSIHVSAFYTVSYFNYE